MAYFCVQRKGCLTDQVLRRVPRVLHEQRIRLLLLIAWLLFWLPQITTLHDFVEERAQRRRLDLHSLPSVLFICRHFCKILQVWLSSDFKPGDWRNFLCFLATDEALVV